MQRRIILIFGLLSIVVAFVLVIVLVRPAEQSRQHARPAEQPGQHARPAEQPGQQASTIRNCHIFPANNIWNYDISHLPVYANSAKYIANIGMNNSLFADFGNSTWGIPYNIVQVTQLYVP